MGHWRRPFGLVPADGAGLTSQDDEALPLLQGALVQPDLLIRAGERAEGGGAGGAGLAPPPVGRPPPQAEAAAKPRWFVGRHRSFRINVTTEARLELVFLTQVESVADVRGGIIWSGKRGFVNSWVLFLWRRQN